MSFLTIFLVKSIFSNFRYCQNSKTWIFKGKKPKILVKFLLKGRNTIFSAKIQKFSFSEPSQGVRNYESINSQTILDINYVDFLQFQRYFRPQAELEEAFIYIICKPIDFSIDFSCRLKT